MRIETDRLVLRPLGLEDMDDLVAMGADPGFVEFFGARTRRQELEMVQRCLRGWQNRGHDLMAVLERRTGRFLGRGGLRWWPEFGEVETGWAFRQSQWGQG